MAERRKEQSKPNGQPEKGLPVNVDAEKFVLGSILLDERQYIQAAANLNTNDFSLDKHRRIFKRMAELHGRGEHIDRITLANELEKFNELEACGGLTYLVELDDGLPQLPNIDSYIRIVKEKSTLRQIIVTSQHTINRAMMDEESSAEILSGARESMLLMGARGGDDGPQTPEQIIRSLPGGMNEFLGPPKKGLSTGFNKLDEYTGGLHSGEFIIIAARPSVGKTALALNIAQHVSLRLQKSVMIFSLEMSKMQLLNRMVCTLARVDSNRVRAGYLTAEERRRLAIAAGQLVQTKLYIDDRSAATITDMHARVRRRIAEDGSVDLVIVDYLQLMAGARNFENRNQEITSISRGMKLMSNEIKAPVIALSQLSRAPELRKGNNRPQLSDLRESGAIEQDADTVHFLFRPEMYARDREDLRGLAELIIGKQRSGPVGTVNLVFLHAQTKFENRAEDVGDVDTGQEALL